MNGWNLPRRERSAQGGKSWEALEGVDYRPRREFGQLLIACREDVITEDDLREHASRLLGGSDT